MDSDRVEGGERKKMRMDRLGDGVQKTERGVAVKWELLSAA